MICAFIIFAAVLYLRSGLNAQADFGSILVPTVIQGAAMAFFFSSFTGSRGGRGMPPL